MTKGQVDASFDPEIDFVITRGRKRKPVVAGEVRWGRFSTRDVMAFSRKVDDLDYRKIFVVPRVRTHDMVGGVGVLDASALVDLASSHPPPVR